MKSKLTIVVFFICVVQCFSQNVDVSNNTEQNYYDFHPLSTLALGKTFDPNHLGDAKLMPITFKERKEDIQPENSALFTSFDVYLVSNKEELKWSFSYDSKVSARFFKAKASSSISFLNNFEFKSNSIYLVVNAKSEFSRTSIDNVEFTELAKKYVQKPKRFEDIFGSRIVTMVRKGIAIWVLISIDDVSYSLLNKIRYTSSASGKFGPIKGSAEVDIKNELKFMRDRKKINLQIFSNGGRAINEYDDILTALTADVTDFSDLKKTIAKKIFSNLSISDAAPIGYHTTSIKSLGVRKGWKIKDKVISSEFENTLGLLSDLYNSVDNQILELNSFLNGKNPQSQLVVNTELLSIRNKYIPKLEEYKNKISDLHTTTLFKYDDISEDDYDNKRNFDAENNFIKNINSEVNKIRLDLPKQFPIMASALNLTWNEDNLEMTCPKTEELKFKVYFDRDIGGILKIAEVNFSELCFMTNSPFGRIGHCAGTTLPPTSPFKENTTKIWGRLDRVTVSKDDMKNSILGSTELRTAIGSADPNTKMDFDLYLSIKSPYIGEKTILIGKVYWDRRSTAPNLSMNVSFYDNVFSERTRF